MGATINQTLEAYVHSATAHLPESDRMLEQREMHQHLSALIAAHEELGDTTETATEAALKQLGDARVIREELLKTHRRAKFYGLMNRPLSEFWTFYSRRRLTAFRQSWIGAIVCTIFAIYSVYTFVPMVLDLVYNPRNPANNQTVLEWYGFALFFLQCWLWGWLSSLLSGRRCLPVIASLVVWFNFLYIVPQFVRGPSSYEDWILLVSVTSGTIILPILAAYISLRQSRAFGKA